MAIKIKKYKGGYVWVKNPEKIKLYKMLASKSDSVRIIKQTHD